MQFEVAYCSMDSNTNFAHWQNEGCIDIVGENDVSILK
jgi:hypothetical protein